MLLDLLTSEHAQAQVDRARAEYDARRTGLVDALHARGVDVRGDDGLHVWVRVTNESSALVALASLGIGAAPGSPYRVDTHHEDAHLCLTTSGLRDAQLTRVADAVAEVAVPALSRAQLGRPPV